MVHVGNVWDSNVSYIQHDTEQVISHFTDLTNPTTKKIRQTHKNLEKINQAISISNGQLRQWNKTSNIVSTETNNKNYQSCGTTLGTPEDTSWWKVIQQITSLTEYYLFFLFFYWIFSKINWGFPSMKSKNFRYTKGF